MSQGIWSQRECVSPLETAGKQLPADRQSLRYFFYFQFWFSPPLKPTQESCTFWEQQTWKRRFWYYRARSGCNTLQQHSPRQLHLTKFTSCFEDLAHRQDISYPSLIWLGAAAALAFWTVSTYLKFHFIFPPRLPHFPDYQSLNAKSKIHVQSYSCYGDGIQTCTRCTTQTLELPEHQLLQENFPKSPQELPDAQRPPLATASCGWDFWLVWTVMRSFLLLLICLPDHDLRTFIIGLGFFPVGKKSCSSREAGDEAAVMQRRFHFPALQRFPSLPHAICLASVTLPTLQRWWEEKNASRWWQSQLLQE